MEADAKCECIGEKRGFRDGRIHICLQGREDNAEDLNENK